MTAIAAFWMGAKPVGYLARVGPAPLRFQAPAKGPEHTVELPPLAMKEPEPVVEPAPAPSTNETTTVEIPVPEPTPVIPAEPIGPQPFTPQMLLQFFTSTNKESSVIMPYQFTPPPAANIPPPPSKATYSIK